MGRTPVERLTILVAVAVVSAVVIATATASNGGSSDSRMGESAVLVPLDGTASSDSVAAESNVDPNLVAEEVVEEDPATAGTDPVEPIDPVDGTVLMIGDSTIAALDWNSSTKRALQGAEFTLDLESCRRLYASSCNVQGNSAPGTAYEVAKSRGPGHETMMVFGGYNDSGRGFEKSFVKVVEAARGAGITRIVWASYRQDPGYVAPDDPLTATSYRANNLILEALMATGDYPDVEIADWNTYSAGQDHWFSDNVHLTALGGWGAADYLSRKLAFLERRACPQPRRPDQKRQNPCPDPDNAPPDVDYAAVYAFKAGRLLCYDVVDPKHIECKPPNKVDDEDTANAVLKTLTFGTEGRQVTNLQLTLKKAGLYKGATSGVYDKDTLIAVLRYQIRQKLAVTGTAGPRTREKLGFGCPDVQRDDAGKCPVDDEDVLFIPKLGKGDRGALVWVLQQRLRELDYLSTKPNSVFGTKTQAAVKKFQAEHGLDETGIVDKKTALELGFIVPSAG